MLLRRAADVVAISHFSLVAFVVAGGFVARRHPRVTKAHLATLAATAGIYAAGFDCPLTDWEKGLRRLAGDPVYAGGYLEHYLISPFHPAGMNPAIGLAILGVAVGATVTAYRDRLPGRAAPVERPSDPG